MATLFSPFAPHCQGPSWYPHLWINTAGTAHCINDNLFKYVLTCSNVNNLNIYKGGRLRSTSDVVMIYHTYKATNFFMATFYNRYLKLRSIFLIQICLFVSWVLITPKLQYKMFKWDLVWFEFFVLRVRKLRKSKLGRSLRKNANLKVLLVIIVIAHIVCFA